MTDIILWNSRSINDAPVRPAGVHTLASWLRNQGYVVKVIDFCNLLSADELVSITEKNITSNTIAIGVGSTFWKYPAWSPFEPLWVIRARTRLEKKYPKLFWLLGGSASVNSYLRFSWTKFNGYAEDNVFKWMDENTGKLRRRELFDIKTCAISFSKEDHIQPFEVLPLELGRGCQFKCKFCAYPLIGKPKGSYIRDLSVVREELIRNYNEYGTTRYYILDDTVNESEEKIAEFSKIVQSLPFRLEWTGYNRLDLIWSRKNTIQSLRDSGLRSTFFGIESFHPTASLMVGKGWNGKLAKEFLLELKEDWKDITWSLGFIVGLTGETLEDLDSTLSWCIDNKMHSWYFTGLGINLDPAKVYKSEFELNYEKYGYYFPTGDTINWVNNLWTQSSAQEYANILNNRSIDHARVRAWPLAEYINNNYSYDELMYLKDIDLPREEFKIRTQKFIQNYVSLQLA